MMLPPVDEKTFTEEEESTYKVTQQNWYYEKSIKLLKTLSTKYSYEALHRGHDSYMIAGPTIVSG